MAASAPRIRLGAAAYAIDENLPRWTVVKLPSDRQLQCRAGSSTASLRIRQ